jgi:hypothetical protein
MKKLQKQTLATMKHEAKDLWQKLQDKDKIVNCHQENCSGSIWQGTDITPAEGFICKEGVAALIQQANTNMQETQKSLKDAQKILMSIIGEIKGSNVGKDEGNETEGENES